MSRHIILFIAAFAMGCVVALAARSAWFKPYDEQAGHPPVPAEYTPMVSNPSAPANDPHANHGGATDPAREPMSAPAPASAAGPGDHPAGHGTVTAGATVNTVCAICGMDVDPSITPAEYQGKLVGFGCRMCPPKFSRDPDRYGPAALENKIVTH